MQNFLLCPLYTNQVTGVKEALGKTFMCYCCIILFYLKKRYL